MQINNLFIGTQTQNNAGATTIRAGEVIQAVIKEKYGHNQATVMMKGQEYPATFEGDIPSKGNITVEVVRVDENGQAILKPLTEKATPPSNQNKLINDLMMKMGLDPNTHPELREALRHLSEKGYRLNEDHVSKVNQFINKEQGSYDEKFSTIQALALRRLEITALHLSAIHSALLENSGIGVLLEYLEESRSSLEKDAAQREAVPKNNEHTNKQLDKMNGSPTPSPDVQIDEGTSNGTSMSNPNTDNHKGLQQELATENIDISEENPKSQNTDSQPVLTQREQAIINDATNMLNLDSKNILVTEITKKLSQLTIDFKKMKNDAVKYLEHINRAIEGNKPINTAQVKQQIESTINKLDNAILKGNYMLYTDMSTEKKLLSASSQLAKAKELMTKGSYSEANQIVKEVKTLLNNITFEPKVTKVMHFVSEQSLLKNEAQPPKPLLAELQQTIKPIIEQEPSARGVFETVKRMGLIHENQTAHALMGTSKSENEPNLKTTLMRMIQLEDGHPRNVQALEQSLTNLTGQQLLNKPNSSGMQNIFMQLPVMLDKEIENVKVYVNSQKKGKGVDWENCNLYFVLGTKHLGDIGVVVNAKNRNLSITLKNNHERFAEKATHFTEDSLQRLKEIGYNVGAINFKTFEEHKQEKTGPLKAENDVMPEQTSPERGYDFKV